MFDNEFEVVVADTDFGRSINYHLRYKVYCLETEFEDADKFRNKEECDEFDESAEAHFLVRSRRTGEWIAAMRMIKADFEALPTASHAVIEKDICTNVDHSMIEISRLCIVSSYRKKKSTNVVCLPGTAACAVSPEQAEEKSREPEIMLGLLRAAYRYSLNNDISSWLFMITPSLARLLDKIGLSIEKVGPVSDYRGKRAPHICNMQTFTSKLSEKSLALSSMFERREAYSEFSKFGVDIERDQQIRCA